MTVLGKFYKKVKLFCKIRGQATRLAPCFVLFVYLYFVVFIL